MNVNHKIIILSKAIERLVYKKWHNNYSDNNWQNYVMLMCGVAGGPTIRSRALARVGDNERRTTHWLNIRVAAHLHPGLDAQLFVTFSWPLSGFLKPRPLKSSSAR